MESINPEPITAETPGSPVDAQASRSRSLGLIVGGAAGIAGSLFVAAVVAGFAVLTYFEGGSAAALGPGIQAISLAAVGLLGLPLLYWATRADGRLARRVHWGVGPLAAVLFVGGLVLGAFAFSDEKLAWTLGPIAHLMAASGPVVAITFLVLRAGPNVSNRRRWGHFLGGLWAAPPVALILELLALIPAAVLTVLGLAVSERGLSLLQALASADYAGTSEFNQLLGGLISEPVVVVVAFAFIAAVVPLIEEAVKSVSIWPLISRRPSAAQAFLGGALCGSGYALFESLFLATPGEDWLPSMVARAGTPLVHAFATGLVSWGLIEAVVNRKPLRLLGLYLGAVSLHGTWNFMALIVGVSGFSVEPGVDLLSPGAAVMLAGSGLIVLLALSALCLAGLIAVPRGLARR